jgi:hypothetical protein
MKKFILALAGAAALLSSAPVLAQSANDAMRYDEARDPAYRAATRSGQSIFGGYHSCYSCGYVIPSIFGAIEGAIANDRHRPRNGELRTLPDGTTVSYDKRSNTWLLVHVPVAQPRAVYADRDTYAAQ